MRYAHMITDTNIIRAREGSFNLHSHDKEQEFHFFFSGNGVFTNASQKFEITGCTLTFSTEKQAHAFMSNRNSKSPVIFYYLRFILPEKYRYFIPKIKKQFLEGVILKVHENQLRPFFEELRNCFVHQESFINKSTTHSLLSFLNQLAGGYYHRNLNIPSSFVAQTIKKMQSGIYKNLKFKDFLSNSGLTASHFIRKFKKETGSSPIQYYIKLKMNTACNLLRETSVSINRIAMELSYCDEFHFSRSFKKIVGISPNEYRLRSQKQFLKPGDPIRLIR
jgi:AraC-like DNA-binding protein